MPSPSTSFTDALTKAITEPVALVHHFLQNESYKNGYKLTELGASLFRAGEHLGYLAAHPLRDQGFEVIKHMGKFAKSEGLLYGLFIKSVATGTVVAQYSVEVLTKDAESRKTWAAFKQDFWKDNPAKVIIFADTSKQAKTIEGAEAPFASGVQSLLNRFHFVKMSLLTTASALEVYVLSKKYLCPASIKQLESAFVSNVGKLSARIGGERLVTMAGKATNFSAGNVKNYCLLGFLALAAAGELASFLIERANENASEDKADRQALKVMYGLKAATCFGKVAMLTAALQIVKVPKPLLVGVGVVVCWIDLHGVYQESNAPDPTR